MLITNYFRLYVDASVIGNASIEPALFELEITESVLMSDTAHTLDTLCALQGLGVRIAMHDFGTGYSSLSYLKLFPFNRLKIDRSFVQELSDNPEAAAFVRAIVALGRSRDMRTTAEGVETAPQLEFLQHENCEEVQGYLFSRPVTKDQIDIFLDSDPNKRQKIAV